jgi:hypothetical protein
MGKKRRTKQKAPSKKQKEGTRPASLSEGSPSPSIEGFTRLAPGSPAWVKAFDEWTTRSLPLVHGAIARTAFASAMKFLAVAVESQLKAGGGGETAELLQKVERLHARGEDRLVRALETGINHKGQGNSDRRRFLEKEVLPKIKGDWRTVPDLFAAVHRLLKEHEKAGRLLTEDERPIRKVSRDRNDPKGFVRWGDGTVQTFKVLSGMVRRMRSGALRGTGQSTKDPRARGGRSDGEATAGAIPAQQGHQGLVDQGVRGGQAGAREHRHEELGRGEAHPGRAARPRGDGAAASPARRPRPVGGGGRRPPHPLRGYRKARPR